MNKPPKRAKSKRVKEEPKRIVISEQEAGSYSTSKKRIALMFSGQPRHSEVCWKSQLRIFGFDGYKIDCFVHSWVDSHVYNYPDNPDTGNNRYALRTTDGVSYDPKELSEKLKQIYEPKSMIVEDYSNDKMLSARKVVYEATKAKNQTHPTLKHIQQMGYKFTQNKTLIAESRFAQMYSMEEACRLKSEFERKNNFKYDIAVKTRQDLLFKPSIDIKKELEETVESKSMASGFFKLYNKETKIGGLMGDIVFASNSEVMDSFCLGFFDSLVSIYTSIAKGDLEPKTVIHPNNPNNQMMYFWPESILYQRAVSKNINLKHQVFPMLIYRNYMRKLPQDYSLLNNKEEHFKYNHLFHGDKNE